LKLSRLHVCKQTYNCIIVDTGSTNCDILSRSVKDEQVPKIEISGAVFNKEINVLPSWDPEKIFDDTLKRRADIFWFQTEFVEHREKQDSPVLQRRPIAPRVNQILVTRMYFNRKNDVLVRTGNQ